MSFIHADGTADRGRNDSRRGAGYNRGMLSLRRIGGRMVIAAAVAAVAILVFRDQGGDRRPVRWTIDPRPLGAEVRAIDVTLAVGGNWPGPPNKATRFPAEFAVDYVRVW